MRNQRKGKGGVVLQRILSQQSVRFLLVGGVNTALGFFLYWVFLLAFENLRLGYLLSLGLSWAISITVAFVLYRRFVFIVRGNVLVDYLRFVSVYIVSIVINAVGLAALVELVSLPALASQLIMLVVTTIMSYAGHRWFSFRRAPAATSSHATDGDFPNGRQGAAVIE